MKICPVCNKGEIFDFPIYKVGRNDITKRKYCGNALCEHQWSSTEINYYGQSGEGFND